MDIAVLIVNSLAVLAAVVGLIITSVQFKKTMDAQNRAISVSLFELRTEVLASVESGKLDFNRTKAQFLFERSISDKIKEYDAAISEYRRYKCLKDEFVSLIQSQRADDTYEEATDFLRAIQDYDSADPDSPDFQQLQEAIRRNSYTKKWMNGVTPFDIETVNYVDASENETACHSKAESLRKEITEEIRKFIETSIR